MKAEIGSEFWSGCTQMDGTGISAVLPGGFDTRFTLCGRTALEIALRDALENGCLRTVYMPSYCCHTMIEPFVSKGLHVVFYDVFWGSEGLTDDFDENNSCDIVFLMDYFGFYSSETAQRAVRQKQKGKLLIYDATHSLFCRNIDYSQYDYVFGSVRKWMGLNAGFCSKAGQWEWFPALKSHDWYVQVRNEALDQKHQFMMGHFSEKQAFLNAFASAEERLEYDYIGYGPDDRSVKVLNGFDPDSLYAKRRKNASYVISRINNWNSSVIKSPYKKLCGGACPLFVPLYVASSVRGALRSELIRQQVYFPMHWPLSPLHCCNERSEQVYNTELSFVCDQRYDIVDMERALRIIEGFI